MEPRVDSSNRRTNPEECLPREVLEDIMGHLDRETLCTARLVSKTFCAAASARVCSLTLTTTSKAVSFQRFPHLEHVTVEHAYPELYNEEKSLAHLDPCLRDFATALTITHMRYKACITRTRDYLSQAALMPKRRKLEVKGDVKHEAELLALCTNLEAIQLEACSMSVARTIVTMTRLTRLHIFSVQKDNAHRSSKDFSWLEHATILRNLRTLYISTPCRALPLIGNLTGLTGLTLYVWDADVTSSIGPLTRLARLKSLSIPVGVTESNLAIACSLGLGSLVNLRLRACGYNPADCGRYLSYQTALTRLSLGGQQLCNFRHIGALRIELLHCLEVWNLGVLDAEGLSVLSRATSLTKLCIATDIAGPQTGFSQVLGRLTQLRSLSLTPYDSRHISTNFLDFPLALNPLTALTELDIWFQDLNDGAMGALLLLTGLRVLELHECRLAADVLPKLGLLTNLNTLRAWRCGINSLAPVSEVLDPLRNARGLPPLYTGGV